MKRRRAAHFVDLTACLDALTLDAPLPAEVRLFAAGTNETMKGSFLFDDKAAKSVAETSAKWGVDTQIDFEHDILNPFIPGQNKATAAWCKLEVRSGELWIVNVRWTDAGAKSLRAKDKRYLSPFFAFDEDGRVTKILNVALVAVPATFNAPALVAASMRGLDAMDGDGDEDGSDGASSASSGVIEYEDTPAKDSPRWDEVSGRERIAKWASTDGTGDLGTIDFSIYRRAFAWCAPDAPEQMGSYKLLHHDVESGELVTSRPALMAACKQMVGGGGIPEADREGVRAHLAQHCAQYGIRPPWAADDEENETMNKLAMLIATLGLGSFTSDDAAVDALSSHVTKVTNEKKELETFRAEVLGTTGTDNRTDALAQVKAWKGEAEKVPGLTAQVKAIETEKTKATSSAKLDALIAEGKMWPAEKDGFMELAAESPKIFERQLAARTNVIVPAEQRKPATEGTNGQAANGGSPGAKGGLDSLSADELMICRKRGVDPVVYLANKKLEAHQEKLGTGFEPTVTRAHAVAAGLTPDEIAALNIK